MRLEGLTYLPLIAGGAALALFLGLYAVAWIQTRSARQRSSAPPEVNPGAGQPTEGGEAR